MNYTESGDVLKSIRRKKIPPYANKLFLTMIFIATFFMGIGYAAVNSVLLVFSGNVTMKELDGVYITDIRYVKNENSLDTEKIKIYSAGQTIVNSLVTLDSINTLSNVKLDVLC